MQTRNQDTQMDHFLQYESSELLGDVVFYVPPLAKANCCWASGIGLSPCCCHGCGILFPGRLTWLHLCWVLEGACRQSCRGKLLSISRPKLVGRGLLRHVLAFWICPFALHCVLLGFDILLFVDVLFMVVNAYFYLFYYFGYFWSWIRRIVVLFLLCVILVRGLGPQKTVYKSVDFFFSWAETATLVFHRYQILLLGVC